MEKYEPLGVVGEGSYGIVLKCKSRVDGRTVAIKKFIDSEDDVNVRKIALREIRVLKKLRHENLVNLLEVFRRRKHLYLVFEFIDHTLLEQLEQSNHGLELETCRKYIFQILRGLGFCHDNGVIHRDVKPENVLVSTSGIVKLCDFGFARNLCGPGDIYTDYVATRWYRAPELLVGDASYGKEVDIWAVGCLFSEMSTGEPLFPGDSDIDQLFLIAQCLGRLSKRHLSIMSKNSAFRGFQFPKSRKGSTASNGSATDGNADPGSVNNANSSKVLKSSDDGNKDSKTSKASLSSHFDGNTVRRKHSNPIPPPEQNSSIFGNMFPSWSEEAIYFLSVCLDPEPTSRPTCNCLMKMPYFTHDNFPARFLSELNQKLQAEGRPPITGSTVRKRRSIVSNLISIGGPNVISSNSNSNSNRSNSYYSSQGSADERHKPFQSNNLLNQSQFPTSTNLARQYTFLVKDAGAGSGEGNGNNSKTLQTTANLQLPRKHSQGHVENSLSKIPVPLSRKSSDESLHKSNNSSTNASNNASTTKDEVPLKEKPTLHGISTNITPPKKHYSTSLTNPLTNDDTAGNSELQYHQHSLPVTTLTFQLGPHATTYNGSTYSTSTVPAPVRSKSPFFSNQSSVFPLPNPNFRRSSPPRIRKKGGGGIVFQQLNSQNPGNPRSLPIGVNLLGSSLGVQKLGNISNNGDHFLPRMTPKNGVSYQINRGGIDENSINQITSNTGNTTILYKKRDKLIDSQSRRTSFTSDLGDIKPFLTVGSTERNVTSPFRSSQVSTLPYMS